MGAGQASQREHHWDAIRAILMLLGIPYHVALSYRAGQDWIVYSGEGLPIFTDVAAFIHLFRMPAFFLIAGYFAALLLSRQTPDDWFQRRLTRLGIPLIVSLLTLVPALNFFAELSNLPWPRAIDSWRHNSMTSGGYWVRHLWFIIVLLYGSAAAAMLVWRKPHLRTAQLPATVDRWIARHFALTLFATAVIVGLWEGAAIEGFYAAGLATNLPQQILRLDEVILFAPYFIGGCLMARAPVTLDRVVRFSPVIAGAAMVSTVAALAFMGHLHPAAGRFLDTIAAVTLTQTIIAVAKRYLDRPIAIVQQGVSAAFVIYLVHLPLVVMLVWLGQGLAVPVAFKATGVMVLTLGLSWGAWRCVAWSPILALLFNGEPLPAAPRPCLA